MEGNKLHVKVPINVIRNEDIYIDNGSFLLYVRLCFLYFKNYQNEEIKIDHRKLMRNCYISDTRTLKKRLDVLHGVGLIENKIDKLPKKDEIIILFNGKVLKDNYFTMMNAKIFNYLEELNEHSLRLLFYYKSHINKEQGKDYCFVGIETLKVKLKMGSDTIKEANDQLSKLKLMKIVKHELKHNHEYDEEDELIFNRYNNHYILNNELF